MFKCHRKPALFGDLEATGLIHDAQKVMGDKSIGTRHQKSPPNRVIHQ